MKRYCNIIKGGMYMSKKQLTVYISIAACAVVVLCVLFVMNLPQSYDKTVVVDNAEAKKHWRVPIPMSYPR